MKEFMGKMTPQQKIRHIALARHAAFVEKPLPEVTDENVDELFGGNEDLGDFLCELRDGDVETEILPPYSRHYESKSVAAKAPDGSWVGWTYWYGGGKHGNPEEIVWVSEAYDLDCREEEKLVVIQTFAKTMSQP